MKINKELSQDSIAILTRLQKSKNVDMAPFRADYVLRRLLRELGYTRVIDAYDKVSNCNI